MFSLLVVALFFLMILAPCLFALRSRWWEEASEPAETNETTTVMVSQVEPEMEASAPEAIVIPAVPVPLGSIRALETEVAATRRLLALCESDVLAAEARLAMAKAKQAADHAALATRAANQAAAAASNALQGVRSEARAASLQARAEKALADRYDGPVVDGSNLPETHPSMDFPRSRVSRRAA